MNQVLYAIQKKVFTEHTPAIAIGGADYTIISSSMTFVSGSRFGNFKCFDIMIADDKVAEDNETFHLVMMSANSRVNLPTNTITIKENDGTYLYDCIFTY